MLPTPPATIVYVRFEPFRRGSNQELCYSFVNHPFPWIFQHCVDAEGVTLAGNIRKRERKEKQKSSPNSHNIKEVKKIKNKQTILITRACFCARRKFLKVLAKF